MIVPVPQGSIFPFVFPNIEINHRHTDQAKKLGAGRKNVGGPEESIESVIIQLEISSWVTLNNLTEMISPHLGAGVAHHQPHQGRNCLRYREYFTKLGLRHTLREN